MSGRFSFRWKRPRNSVASSMIVRSAAKFVSKTPSKPMRRSAVTSLPVTGVPIGMPKHSPIVARMAGAVWTTTCLTSRGRASASQTRSVWSFSRNAAVGQTATHWPHWMQTDSSMFARFAGPTTVWKPRPCWERLLTPWTSEQTRTQRPQRMHFSGVLTTLWPESSTGSCLRFPAKCRSRMPRR